MESDRRWALNRGNTEAVHASLEAGLDQGWAAARDLVFADPQRFMRIDDDIELGLDRKLTIPFSLDDRMVVYAMARMAILRCLNDAALLLDEQEGGAA